MTRVPEILGQIDAGDPGATDRLLAVVYEDLRRLAASKLRREKAGQTLQPTALVHEAFLRLNADERWDSRGHFFAAAAESMRRILVENARRKGRLKHGGAHRRIDLDDGAISVEASDNRVLEIDEALDRLAAEDRQLSDLVKLRFFAGFSLTEAAELLGMSRSKAYEQWAYARAWLRCDLDGSDE